MRLRIKSKRWNINYIRMLPIECWKKTQWTILRTCKHAIQYFPIKRIKVRIRTRKYVVGASTIKTSTVNLEGTSSFDVHPVMRICNGITIRSSKKMQMLLYSLRGVTPMFVFGDGKMPDRHKNKFCWPRIKRCRRKKKRKRWIGWGKCHQHRCGTELQRKF